MYRNFYPAWAGVSQYFYVNFLGEPYGIVECWIGPEKRKADYPT